MSTRPEPVRRVLTGITTSGMPHLGNYAGAIRPAIAASRQAGVESFYFLADYHALTKAVDPARLQRSTLETAATWLAAGLDPDKVWFYRQSDIPEILELTWLLACIAGKGLLNRAHAYKATVDKNTAEGQNPDAGVNMGLFMYPVLMAADILMFKAHSVPVGCDQLQHVEMARDMAARFNHRYGEHFVLPEAAIDQSVATLPGLDGRKMSKSYDNTVPLFVRAAELKKLIFSVITDSRAASQPKETEGSSLFQLYQAFASQEETAAMRTAFVGGISWSEAKQALFERIDAAIAPMRKRYEELVADPARIEQRLQEGAAKARAVAAPFLAELRQTVGLRNLALGIAAPPAITPKSASLPRFKQHRGADGRFHFTLVDRDGRVLLQSVGFESPREAERGMAELKQGDPLSASTRELRLGETVIATLADGVHLDEISAALAALGG